MQTLIFEQNQEIGILKINRPEAMNALNSLVLKELAEWIDEHRKDTSLRVLILTGQGEKAFVAGADIKELDGLDSKQAAAFAGRGQSVFRKLEELPYPVIAAVNGFALGGGLELAMACDFIIASEKARFGLPEVGLGIMPGFGGCVRLMRYVGLAKAKELAFSGEMISAAEAFSWGLVNKVYPPELLLSEVLKLASTIASRGPLGVAKVKQVMTRSWDCEVDLGLKLECEAFSQLFGTSDQREGTRAFVEKRKPEFVGR